MSGRVAWLASALCLLACNSPRLVSFDGGQNTEGACTPEAQCSACGTCFDACLCGGGAARRCAESCGASATGDAGEGDASTGPDAPLVGTFVTDSFDIPPGKEFFRCQNFANPFGRDVAVLRTDSFMTAGSHHMFAFQVGGIEDGALEECSGIEFHGYLHLTQRSQETLTNPPGVGRFLSATEGIRLAVHYLNASEQTVHTEVAFTLRATEPSHVFVLASQIFANTLSISVPPHSAGSSVHSCTVPKDVSVFETGSHMHQHGTHFTARASDGQLLFETNQWAEPEPWRFASPRKLKAGTVIDVDCEYQNTTDQPLSFGESAATNEMCIFIGGYYPAAAGESITCLF